MYVTASNIPWIVGVQAFDNKKKGIIKYVDKKVKPLRDLDGYPGVKPPWGTLTAMNLNTGKIIWQVPLGHYKKLKSKHLTQKPEKNYGHMNYHILVLHLLHHTKLMANNILLYQLQAASL